MKKNTVFLKAAGRATGLPALLLALGLAASVSLALAGCDTGGGEEEGGGNTLPTAKGVNALSGKTYFDYSDKIVFSTTADGDANGTFTIGSTIWNETTDEIELEDGKYKYVDRITGYYSWDDTTKTVTISPEKVAGRFGGGESNYSPLQNKAGFRAETQKMLDNYKKEMGEVDFNQQLASMGFSSAAAYLDYVVADTFKNIPYNYAFSADGKALFLDESLPVNKGSNELARLTFYGVTWDNDNEEDIKDPRQIYAFSDTACVSTRTYGENSSSTETYAYSYNSSEKMVYLKTPTTGRDDYYATQSNNTTNSGNFSDVDAYNAAQVNSQYNRLEAYKYDTAEKVLQRR
jgi:hypothetical protein